MNGGYVFVPDDISKAIADNIEGLTQTTVLNSYNRMKNIVKTGKPILLVCDKLTTGENLVSFLASMSAGNTILLQLFLSDYKATITISSDDKIAFIGG